MANTIRSTGVILGTTKVAVLTCVVGTQVAVTDLVVSNPTAAARAISLWHYTAADATERPVLNAFSIASGVTPIRLLGRLALQPGDEIRALADAAGAVTMLLTNGIVSAATPAAKGFAPKGTYAAATTYVTNDVVTYTNGSGVQASYVSLQDANKGNPPDTSGAYWTVLAAQGPAGSAGTGVVKGPTSATDGAVGLFDGTTGTLIKDSGVKIGTAAGNIPPLDAQGKLQALDGSRLINLPIAAQARYSRVVFLTTSQTWTAPANIRGRVTVVGGGGSGGLINSSGSGNKVANGGAAGGLCVKTFTAPAGTVFTATVGSGGAARGGPGVLNGNSGGSSAFSASAISLSMTANGGSGGNTATAAVGTAVNVAAAVGGTATGGDLNYQGGGAGAASVSSAPGGFSNYALTGGGAVAFFGIAYSSGAASISTSGTNNYAATGGAGIGGSSGAVTAASGSGITAGSGGGSANGPSGSGSYGGPDIFGATGSPYGTSPLPPVDFTVFNFGGRGGFSSGTSQIGVAGDPGGGGGSVGASDSQAATTAGAGGYFAGGGAAYQASTSATGGAGAFGGGGGAAAATNATATSGPGGQGIIIIEYDLV